MRTLVVGVLAMSLAALSPGELGAQSPHPVAARAAQPSLDAFDRSRQPRVIARPMTGREAIRGLVLGAMLGGAVGALAAHAMCDRCDDASPVVFGGGVGAAIGALVGLLVEGNRVSRQALARR